MAITVTEKAAAEVKKVHEQQKFGEDMFLRVKIAAGGCSGFEYRLNFDKEYDDAKDTKYSFHGVDVVVDKKSALYLDSTTLDFHDGIDQRGFKFDDPTRVKTCGCGSSFQA